jgi:magnesium transporter
MAKNVYPKHTVGEHIVSFPLTFHKDHTVSHALSIIEDKQRTWPNTEFIFIYVTDSNGKLNGVIDFKTLLSAKKSQTLEYIMKAKFFSVTDHTHQENAAKLALTEGLETIPVTDSNGHFLGILDAEQIFQILHENHVEKLMHFSGVLNSDSLGNSYKTSVSKVVASRLPWLILGLIGGILATSIVKEFSHTLEANLSLAFFIPVIVYMNDAVGTQTQTIFVRYSSLERIKLAKALFYELRVSIIVGVLLAIGIYAFTYLWLTDGVIAFIVSLSMFLGILSSAIIGTIIPWILDKLGKDPAIGSGPFTTILQDLLSIMIYFSIATALL